MAFWRKKRRKKRAVALPPEAETKNQKNHTKKFLPVEVKLLAAEASVAGRAESDVAEIVGSGSSTVQRWANAYVEGGTRGAQESAHISRPRGHFISPSPQLASKNAATQTALCNFIRMLPSRTRYASLKSYPGGLPR
jgi:hypothetical protein